MFAVLLAAEGPAHAQSPPSIAGSVIDQTGLALSHVVVALTGPAERAVVTGTDGTFAFGDLPAGTYDLEATRPRFAPARAVVELSAGEAARLTLTLTVQLLDETTVTATRLGETRVQSTALAVTALSAADLDRVGTHSISELAGLAPAVTFSQNSDLAQLTIRGIGTNVVFAGSDPSSAVYIDGVYQARPVMVTTDFLDVERVEIVRGPQGTLYGRNAVGGAIHLISRSPTNEFEATADVSAGDHGMFRTQLRVAGPIVSGRVMASAAFLRGVRRGYVDDVDHPGESLGGEDVVGGRGQLRVLLGDRADVLVSADAILRDPIPLTYAKVLQVKPGFSIDNPPDLHEVRTSTAATSRISQQGASVRLTFALPHGLTMTSLSAFRALDYQLFIDADITELSLLTSQVHERQEQFSQEVTVTSNRPGLGWTAGAFWFDETDRHPIEVGFGGPRLVGLLDPRVDATAKAVFAQASVGIMSGVTGTFGIRYSDEHKTIENYGQSSSMDPPGAIVPGSVYQYRDTNDYTAWTPKIGVEFEPAAKALVYVSAARGFKSGGFNMSSRAPGLGYGPEWVWTYEGGLKKTSADDRAFAALAVFQTDYTNLQVQTPIAPGVLDISNAAAATIRGVELEGTLRIRSGASIGGHLAWLDATYDNYLAVGIGGITGDAAGNRLNNAPEWSGRAWFQMDRPVGAHLLTLRADARWQSTVFFTPFNDDLQRQPAYGVLDLNASFGPPQAGWSVSAFVRNVSNTGYITGTFTSPPPAIGGRPGDPRQFGVRLRVTR